MHRAPAITAAILDKILLFLAPLFLDVCAGDADAAKAAARALLASYNPATDHELRHAALIIAFSFGALDALSRSAAAELDLKQVLRLRGNANALNRAALLNEKALNALRAAASDEAPAASADLPASLEPADLVSFARQAAPLSRQQRRAMERQAEKAEQRRQEQARLAERAARLAERRGAATA
nr:hypothetical protein [uncultured Rhodopila sp.]